MDESLTSEFAYGGGLLYPCLAPDLTSVYITVVPTQMETRYLPTSLQKSVLAQGSEGAMMACALTHFFHSLVESMSILKECSEGGEDVTGTRLWL